MGTLKACMTFLWGETLVTLKTVFFKTTNKQTKIVLFFCLSVTCFLSPCSPAGWFFYLCDFLNTLSLIKKNNKVKNKTWSSEPLPFLFSYLVTWVLIPKSSDLMDCSTSIQPMYWNKKEKKRKRTGRKKKTAQRCLLTLERFHIK